MSASVQRMNLVELRAAHPQRFYVQSWFLGEPFMRTLPDDNAPTIPPVRVVRLGLVPRDSHDLLYAVDLAHAFVGAPDDPIWQYYFWCADTDRAGQRVYVGVTAGLFEIHRHLHVTPRFGVPAYR